MRYLYSLTQVFSLLLVLTLGQHVHAVTENPVATNQIESSSEQIESLIRNLEDPQQREQLVVSLRILLQTKEQQAKQAGKATVKTAAAELVELLAVKVGDLAQSLTASLDTIERLPDVVKQWWQYLRDPGNRERWLLISVRLITVLGAGFAAAAMVTWLIRRVVRRRPGQHKSTQISRMLRLFGHLFIDLFPIVIFALAAYAMLTVVDLRQETRLVAVALIDASILSRLIRIVSAFFFSPERPQLRLWQMGDETAHYTHQWIKRLSVIAIYGFFSLQASFLLGLDPAGYQTLLRLLGLIILALLLVLIAQNRDDVARVIVAEPESHAEESTHLSSLRKGLGRVWHLITGLYLIAIYAIWILQVENGAQFVLKATLLSLLVIAISRLLVRGTDHLFERGMQLPSDLRNQFPGLEKRLNRYFPALRKILKFAIIAFTILLLVSAWGMNTLEWFTEGAGKVLLGAVLNVLMIVMVALFFWELASGSIERYLGQTDNQGKVRVSSPRMRTLLTVARNALLVVLTVVAALMVLSELGINIAPLLAGAGVVGLAIGFGSQRLVQDVINGAFILFQDLMSVGDVVKLGDKAGVVEALSIRTVRLRDLAGTVHTIPFSTIEGVSNLTREFSYHVFDLGIAYREDVDEVIELLKQIGEELRADAVIGPLIYEPLEVFGLDAFGDSAIVIKGRIKTQPIKQWQVGRAFNRLVKKRFDEQGIEIPFPHRTLYFGQDKRGDAPPAFVQIEAMLRDNMPAQSADQIKSS